MHIAHDEVIYGHHHQPAYVLSCMSLVMLHSDRVSIMFSCLVTLSFSLSLQHVLPQYDSTSLNVSGID